MKKFFDFATVFLNPYMPSCLGNSLHILWMDMKCHTRSWVTGSRDQRGLRLPLPPAHLPWPSTSQPGLWLARDPPPLWRAKQVSRCCLGMPLKERGHPGPGSCREPGPFSPWVPSALGLLMQERSSRQRHGCAEKQLKGQLCDLAKAEKS